MDTIERISASGRVLIKEGTDIKFSVPGGVLITKNPKEPNSFQISNNYIMQELGKGLNLRYEDITTLLDDGVPVAKPGNIDGLIELLSTSFFLAINPKIDGNEARIQALESQLIKVTNFEIISTATGSITIPTGANILLDQFEGVVDAIVSEIDGSNTPTWDAPFTGGGAQIFVSSFNTAGNYVLSGTPVGNIAIIYVYSVARIDFNIADSIGFETLDITASEIEVGYNSIVPIVTQPEAEAGTSTVVKRWTPERVAQAIAALSISSSDVAPTKSGVVAQASFAGNPKVYDVVFGTAFADANYSIVIACKTISGTGYTPVYEFNAATGFRINMTANNINNLIQVSWIAIKHGEYK